MTPREYWEVSYVEKALEVARNAAELFGFDWFGFLRTLESELVRQFEPVPDPALERLNADVARAKWSARGRR